MREKDCACPPRRHRARRTVLTARHSPVKLPAMTYRLAADAWDHTQIPATFNARNRIVLGYDNWPAAAWARFPQAKKVRIATTAASHGLQYCVLDVEAGDATIAQAPGWIAEQHKIRALWPTIYIEQSNLAALRAACHGLSYSIWLAWWNHPTFVAGTIGTQLGPVNGPDGYDVSRIADAAWQPQT